MRRRSLKKEMDLHDHNRSMVNIITSVCIFLSTAQLGYGYWQNTCILEIFILFSNGFKIIFLDMWRLEFQYEDNRNVISDF